MDSYIGRQIYRESVAGGFIINIVITFHSPFAPPKRFPPSLFRSPEGGRLREGPERCLWERDVLKLIPLSMPSSTSAASSDPHWSPVVTPAGLRVAGEEREQEGGGR